MLSVVDGIVQLAYELAQLSNRSRPNVRDMIAACSDQGIEVHHLLDLLSHAPTPCDRPCPFLFIGMCLSFLEWALTTMRGC
jgi:hypothetical protein